MGTYRLHRLVSGRSVWKSRKISRKKSNLNWCCNWGALLGTMCLARYFLLFLFGVSFIRFIQFPAQGRWGPSRVRIPSTGCGLWELRCWRCWCPELPHFKTSQACFALGAFIIFLLFEGGSPYFAISCTQTITSLRAALWCCARRKNVNLNKPPSQWHLKTDCRISSHFCKALFKNNSDIFIFQLVNREFFQNRGCFLCYSVMSAW